VAFSASIFALASASFLATSAVSAAAFSASIFALASASNYNRSRSAYSASCYSFFCFLASSMVAIFYALTYSFASRSFSLAIRASSLSVASYLDFSAILSYSA